MDNDIDFSKIDEGQIEKCYDLIKNNPNNPIPWVKLSQIYIKFRNFKMARMSVDTAFNIEPNNLAVIKIKAFFHLKIGEYEKAKSLYEILDTHFENQIKLLSNNQTIHKQNLKIYFNEYRMNKFNLSEIEFFHNNYLLAFDLYENRRKIIQTEFINDDDVQLLQQMKELNYDQFLNSDNRSVIVLSEQGYGDQIMISRYLKELEHLGFKVTFIANNELIKFFRCFSELDNINIKGKISRKDLLTNSSIVWSMSLPFLFYKKNIRSFDVLDKPLLKKINLNSPPFRSRNNKKKIGICWRGNPKNRRDNERSIDPNILKNILQNKDYDFFVFHKKINQIDTKIIQKHPNVFSLSDNLNDFYESSCYLNEMNMVITVDTSVLHLAGTLKKKTMALLPFVPDPRWKIQDGKFWYKTIEFIFQNNLNDWSYPLKKVQRVLEQKLI